MRGPSGRGASRLARAGVAPYRLLRPSGTEAETRPLRFTGRQTFLSRANLAPRQWRRITRHETRITAFSTSSTASKRNEVMAVLSRAAASGGEKCRPVIDLPSPLGARASLPASHPCPAEKKRKKRGGDITSIRLRRSLFFVAPATPAGTLSLRKPGETVKALPGRPGRPGCGLPGAPKLPRMRGRCGRTSFGPGAGTVRLGRKSCVGRAVLFAVGAQGSHNQKPPPGPPQPPPSHGFPAHDCRDYPVLCALSRHSCCP